MSYLKYLNDEELLELRVAAENAGNGRLVDICDAALGRKFHPTLTREEALRAATLCYDQSGNKHHIVFGYEELDRAGSGK